MSYVTRIHLLRATLFASTCLFAAPGAYAQGGPNDLSASEEASNEIVVMATPIRDTNVASLELKRESLNVVDIIASDTIGRLPDQNLADSFFAPGLGLYGASKAAANAFVQGWSRDLGPKGITINAVVPGPIDTDMNPADTQLADHLRSMVPLGRYGTPDEVAALTAFLAGPEASFINGARMIIDGGMNV